MRYFKEYDVKGKNVFISGPMTGVEYNNVAEFASVHAGLKEAGAATVYDPALEWLLYENSDTGHDYHMAKSLRKLTEQKLGKPYYDVIVLLSGWEGSDGARVELEVARACGIDVIHAVRVEGDDSDGFAVKSDGGGTSLEFVSAAKAAYDGGRHGYEA